jgi:serine phosphatase RsbU (regulator of sigma subunit)
MEATWLRHTLEEIIEQIRRLLDVSGCAFQVVDFETGTIHPAAAWFATDAVRSAMTPVLARPYDRERPGVTEAAIERGEALLIPRFEEWEGAGPLRERLQAELDPADATLAWDWYRTSSFLSVPVRTAAGRTFGVLALSASAPKALLSDEDLRVVRVFADLAAMALERSELLDREEQRSRRARELADAARAMSASLEPDAVYRAIVEQARRLTGATKAALRRIEPASAELRAIASVGISEEGVRRRVPIGEGMVGEVARSGRPYISSDEDAQRFDTSFLEAEGIRSFAHVPVAIGPRLFAVLSVSHEAPDHFGREELRRLQALAREAAATIANALDVQRERRVARALTRGFIAERVDDLPGYELGLVYEPVGHEVGGGDVFGLWTLGSGALAVLVGDVAGKGLEVAALSAMVRFFIEARTLDCERPGEVLTQADRLVRERLPSAGFVTIFLAVIDGHRMRWANAGHAPPLLLRDDGDVALRATGIPLGVSEDARYEEHEAAIAPGDVLFAATDGLMEARRGRVFFGQSRLPTVLAEHGRTLAPRELVAEVRREVETWAPDLSDDLVILALRPCS